jgi:hypothetical protein
LPARDERTISGLATLIQHSRLKAALKPYTLDGPWAGLLDAERDDLDEASLQGFEMEELLPHASTARALLTYVFRCIERRLDGSPATFIRRNVFSRSRIFGRKTRSSSRAQTRRAPSGLSRGVTRQRRQRSQTQPSQTSAPSCRKARASFQIGQCKGGTIFEGYFDQGRDGQH